MRMWMVDPRILCDKHLLGEHVETHMFAGSILKGTSMRGYLEAGLLDGTQLAKRHERLVEEMKARGMKHQSKFPDAPAQRAIFAKVGGEVDGEASLAELLTRCSRCSERFAALR